MAGGGHGHGTGVLGDFFGKPQKYKGTIAHERGLLIKSPEQVAQNFASAFSNVRKYVQDSIHPLLSAAKDVTLEGLNIKKHGWKAPFRGLAGATLNVLESANRGIKGILDLTKEGYKNLVIDNVNSVTANTTDNLKYIGGIGFGNSLKALFSVPAWAMDKVSLFYENYGPSKWLQWASKKVANPGRNLKIARLVGGSSGKDDHHDDHHSHGGGDHH